MRMLQPNVDDVGHDLWANDYVVYSVLHILSKKMWEQQYNKRHLICIGHESIKNY